VIRAIIFDLDGTLLQTEKLKALSYAIAVQRVRGLAGPAPEAVEAYREIVGVTREQASRHIVEKLGLGEELRPMAERYHVSEPWEVLAAMRAEIYSGMIADTQALRDNQWPHTVELLRVAREAACRTALVTMSRRSETLNVLRALDLEESLDLVLTAESVERGKPAPDIYLLAAEQLGVSPDECLALEDSVNGVRAAIASGVHVVAVATPFTSAGLHSSGVIEDAWIVDEPEKVMELVRRRMNEVDQTAHRSR
jgi:HAD superfamily hydrolase (TIGR01509 family)